MAQKLEIGDKVKIVKDAHGGVNHYLVIGSEGEIISKDGDYYTVKGLNKWFAEGDEDCPEIIEQDMYKQCFKPIKIIKQMTLKVGDKVKLLSTSEWVTSDSNRSDSSNPINIEGTVDLIQEKGQSWLPICVRWDNGEDNSYNEKDLELITRNKSQNTMVNQIMKAALLVVANKLLKANNTVTTLEIKAELRKTDPEFYWDQAIVSRFMSEYESSGVFTYVDNGTYRVYSDPFQAPRTAALSPTQVAKVLTTKQRVPKQSTITGKISRKKALELMQNNKGHFFTAVFIKKDNTERTINCQYLKDQTNSDLGYVKVKETAKLKTKALDPIRQINLQTLKTLKIAGTLYTIK